jgi:ABC-type uncharacterized transport system fused permease/ATPase subunit
MEALDNRTLLKLSHKAFRFLRQYFQNFFIHRTVSLKLSKFNASISPIRRLLADTESYTIVKSLPCNQDHASFVRRVL